MSRTLLSLKNVTLALAAVALTAMTTGCANMVTTAGDGNSFSTPGTMKGTLYGGNQPIASSTVKLYAVGTTGYGSVGTLLATTTTSTTGTGSFQFTQASSGGPYSNTGSTYLCPTSNTLIYIIATGGDPISNGTNNNTAAVFLAALGTCGSSGGLNIVVNEVTSAASVWALQQYINPGATSGATTSIGSPNTAQAKLGLANAFTSIPNLATLSTGVAVTTVTLTGSASTVNGTSVLVTPETTKLNTIANILASCVNNTSSSAGNCTTLFTNAVAPAPAVTSTTSSSFPTAGDTLQAAYYMAVNPADGNSTNVTNLFNLAGGVGGPFQSALTAAPTDWTMGILYLYGSQVGTVAPGNTPNACTGSAAAGALVFYPYLIRADANGNLWVISNHAASSTVGQEPSISEIGPNGIPLACVQPGSAQGAFEGLTIDTSGNIWAAAHVASGGIFEINPSTLATTAWTETGIEPWDIQADGSGNVFYSVASAPIRKFTGAATAGSASAATPIGTAANAVQNYMVIDKLGDIFVADNTGTTAGPLYETYPDAITGTNGYSTYTAGTSANVQAQIAVDASGKIWTTQTTPANSAIVFTPGVPPVQATSSTVATNTAGISTPRGVGIDGAGNAWIADGIANKTAEVDKNGNALSPSTGFTKTLFSQTMRGVAIDLSGNVWIVDNVTTQSVVQEIVGAGVPVVTPLSAQLAGSGPVKP